VLWFLLATILLTPLQGAGEECGFRGLIFRVAGGWARGARAGLVLGIVVSSVLFTIVHLSTDVWLNAWYLVFALGLSLIAWRTGGLEIAIVLHAMFNTVNFVFDVALRVDMGSAYDRPAGVASVETLAPMSVLVVAVVVGRVPEGLMLEERVEAGRLWTRSRQALIGVEGSRSLGNASGCLPASGHARCSLLALASAPIRWRALLAPTRIDLGFAAPAGAAIPPRTRVPLMPPRLDEDHEFVMKGPQLIL